MAGTIDDKRKVAAREQEGYLSPRAARLAGLKFTTLYRWCKTDFIRPSIAEGKGYGSWSVYSFADLVALRVAVRLREAGISLQALRKAIAYLRTMDSSASFSNLFLVAINGDVLARQGEELFSALRQPGQGIFAWVLDMEGIVEELRRDVENERKAS